MRTAIFHVSGHVFSQSTNQVLSPLRATSVSRVLAHGCCLPSAGAKYAPQHLIVPVLLVRDPDLLTLTSELLQNSLILGEVVLVLWVCVWVNPGAPDQTLNDPLGGDHGNSELLCPLQHRCLYPWFGHNDVIFV